MHHDPNAQTMVRLEAKLLRDERALTAGGARLVLHRGREFIAMSGRVAGPAGAREAEQFVELVLWSARSPAKWPVGDMIGSFCIPADLSPADLSPAERALQEELMRSRRRPSGPAGPPR